MPSRHGQRQPPVIPSPLPLSPLCRGKVKHNFSINNTFFAYSLKISKFIVSYQKLKSYSHTHARVLIYSKETPRESAHNGETPRDGRGGHPRGMKAPSMVAFSKNFFSRKIHPKFRIKFGYYINTYYLCKVNIIDFEHGFRKFD